MLNNVNLISIKNIIWLIQEQITLSILVPTIGRTTELDMLLDSIQKQCPLPYEL